MSWVEATKITSDLSKTLDNTKEELKNSMDSAVSAPLKHLLWLSDFKSHGNNSYVFQNKDILYELYRDTPVSINDLDIRSGAIAYLIETEYPLNEILRNYYPFKGVSVEWDEITYSNCFTHSVVSPLIFADDFLFDAIVNSPRAIHGVAKNTNWTQTKPFITAVNKDTTLLCSIFGALSNTNFFTLSYAGHNDTSSALNTYGTREHGDIIAVATGEYSDDNYGRVRVFVNGEVVSEGNLYRPTKPTSVTSGNIGALAVPTATFLDSDDGYCAIACYKAV